MVYGLAGLAVIGLGNPMHLDPLYSTTSRKGVTISILAVGDPGSGRFWMPDGGVLSENGRRKVDEVFSADKLDGPGKFRVILFQISELHPREDLTVQANLQDGNLGSFTRSRTYSSREGTHGKYVRFGYCVLDGPTIPEIDIDFVVADTPFETVARSDWQGTRMVTTYGYDLQVTIDQISPYLQETSKGRFVSHPCIRVRARLPEFKSNDIETRFRVFDKVGNALDGGGSSGSQGLDMTYQANMRSVSSVEFQIRRFERVGILKLKMNSTK